MQYHSQVLGSIGETRHRIIVVEEIAKLRHCWVLVDDYDTRSSDITACMLPREL